MWRLDERVCLAVVALAVHALAVGGCDSREDDEAASAGVHAPAATEPEPTGESTDPTSGEDGQDAQDVDDPAALTAAALAERVFDFRRVVIDASAWTDTEQICAVRLAHDGALREGDSMPSDVVSVALVRCAHPHGAYPVLVGIERARASDPLAPFGHRTRRDEARERHLTLRVTGLSTDGRTPLTMLLASSEAPASTPPRPDPAGETGRCLGCDEPSRDAPALAVGLDFDRVVREPSLAGARGSCAIAIASDIIREDTRPTPTAALPEGVVISMPVTCHHADGTSRATLFFDRDNAAQTLLVRRGAVAHGTVLLGSRLMVSHVVVSTLRDE